MSRLMSEHWPALSRSERDQWRRAALAERTGLTQQQSTMLVLGLVALGVGVLAWSYLGPDLKRYAKIHSM